MQTPRLNNLVKLLQGGLISKDNTDRCVRICYDATKITHYRQERLGKYQLKMREITSALRLVDFHHCNVFRFSAVGPLAENFRDCNEGKALEYYDKKVCGVVTDKFGRQILIDDDGIRSLYKDPKSNKHIVDSEFYEESRGKRLPWIRHVLEQSPSVYVVEEIVNAKFRRTYLYTAIASIPLQPKPSVSYFMVVVSEDGNKRLKFVTAYAIISFNRFLKCIEPGKPLGEG
jgi:hypothetical protein